MGGRGGKANTPACGIGNGACLGGILGNEGIMNFNCNLPDDTNGCSKVFTVLYTSRKSYLDIAMNILRLEWNSFM